MKKIVFLTLIFLSFEYRIPAQSKIPIDTVNFQIEPDNILNVKGRKCFLGDAILKDFQFVNGIIEFDIWTNGEHSYPGIKFRLQPDGTGEHLYLRPHASGKDIAIQYAPSYAGESCWQLYHGKGFTAKYIIPQNEWLHFKAEITDNKAKLFLDNSTTPFLEMELVLNTKEGQIYFSTTGRNTYFSNLIVTRTEPSREKYLPILYSHENKECEISKLQKANVFNSDNYPRFFNIYYAGWENVDSDKNGLLNISRYRKPEKKEKNCVYARRTFYSETNRVVKMAFGYSDAVKIFFNEALLYSGNYAYKSRGGAFSGNIGLFDTLYLELEKGINELFIVSKNDFGGWGIWLKPEQKLSAIPTSFESLNNIWSSQSVDLCPESVVYDNKRKSLYFSNFDVNYSKKYFPSGYISILDTKGNSINKRFIDSLFAPSGICLFNDNIFIAERDGISNYSLTDGTIINKYVYPQGIKFANDIAVSENGEVFITNTDTEHDIVDIYILKNNKIEPWISSEQLSQLNGILYDKGYLVVGNSGKNLLQKISIQTKEIQTIAHFGSGIIDGIRKDDKGDYLVSLWRGELFEINKDGDIKCILSSNSKFNTADFEYIPDRHEIVVPTFLGRKIMCFKRTNE